METSSFKGGAPSPMRFMGAIPRLPAADLRRSLEFYSSVLKFEVCVLWPEEAPVYCLLRRGGAIIAFDEEAGFLRSNASAAGFYLEVENALEIFDSLRSQVAIEWGPEVYHYHRREFAFRDPDHYLIIISEGTGDPVTCPAE